MPSGLMSLAAFIKSCNFSPPKRASFASLYCFQLTTLHFSLPRRFNKFSFNLSPGISLSTAIICVLNCSIKSKQFSIASSFFSEAPCGTETDIIFCSANANTSISPSTHIRVSVFFTSSIPKSVFSVSASCLNVFLPFP